jgi:hypothetical protein
MKVTNSRSTRLLEIVIRKIDHGHPFYKHGQGINLTWLAKEIGATRQIFYPGRGSAELAAIVSTLNNHLDDLDTHPKRDEAAVKVAARTRVEFLRIKSENDMLRHKIRWLEKLNNSFTSTSLMTDLTDDDISRN